MATYLLILYAFRIGSVSYVVAVREMAVVIGVALGMIFLNERLTCWKAIGVISIIIGLVMIKVA